MSDSKIEWTDKTWNPVSGCTKVSQGCKNCYAERLWPKVSAAEAKREGSDTRRPFTDIRCHPNRLDHPLSWRSPKRVFVNSMSDLFHEDVPFSFIDEVWGTMIEAPQHQYQILTKRPERMRQYLLNYTHAIDARITRWPLPQVWLGVSVEDQETAQARVPALWSTPAAVRFVSYEPALGPMKISAVSIPAADVIANTGEHDIYYGASILARDGHDIHIYDLGGIDWIIAGGESGPGARPAHPDWFRSIRDDCKAGNVAFFFKQWGEWGPVGPLYSDDDTVEHLSALDTDPDENHREKWLTPSGTHWPPSDGQAPIGTWAMQRGTKRATGRALDGHTHDEYPI